MTWRRKAGFALLAGALGILLAALLLEVVLRFLPVNEGLMVQPVNEENPVMHFAPSRDFVWSKGGTFAIVARKHSNNEGFLNDQDYDGAATGPLVAIIGDSYVEAAQVDNAEAQHGLLAKQAGNRGRVYSFGASGAQLPAYLTFADHARRKYRPAAMVFTIVGNDFDESLWTRRTVPGLHYFDDETADWPLRRLDYAPSRLKTLGRASALVRYGLLNLDLDWRGLERRLLGGGSAKEFVGNTAANTEAQRVEGAKRAVAEFFKRLPEMTGLPASRILFVLDGMRPELYASSSLTEAERSFFGVMRQHFVKASTAYGAELIDLQEVFLKHYERHGERFEFAIDGHWNELGHRVVAEAISESAVFKAATMDMSPVASK